MNASPQYCPPLDPDFVPASLWNHAYRSLADDFKDGRKVTFTISRPDGQAWKLTTRLLPEKPGFTLQSKLYAERLVKFLLWAWGGNRILVDGAPDILARLKTIYSPKGERAFDYDFMGKTCFGEPMSFEEGTLPDCSQVNGAENPARKMDGYRIGFDLGGSDRKCAALINGEVVFSEEIKWDPYFQADPNYHLEGIRDSLQRAAAHLPRVDAIGGSAAGIYINSEPRVASLFRGISKKDFNRSIRSLFRQLQKEWDGVPFVVANDGDVTALAGSMSLNDNSVLGLSMGTSEAVGYVDPQGRVIGWLNELAFAPIDYREGAPADEWSGDLGCGAQYFSQQAVGRLLPASGIEAGEALPLPEKLELVQDKMKAGDERAAAIYESIGIYLGYGLAHYADFYDFKHLLLLGRVSSGEGGRIILERAQTVLDNEFPELASKIKLGTPDEKMKRHGQAIAAASLPAL